MLTEHAAFDPAADFGSFLKTVPAKWVVYLLADADDRPVQLLCVKNLRASLKRRLGGEETIGLSKRVNYRDLVRHIHFRRVDSAFEADWTYLEAARALFPESYQGMVGFRPAWFIHVDPSAAFPRYTKTIDLSPRSGQLIGPIEDKHAAARLMQLAEDAFDLCRYYNILIEAPHGKACAYKEMGKCPAPCDGSISMDEYHRMVADSAAAIVDPKPAIREQTRLMEQSAAALHFEAAARIKSRIEQLSALGKGPFRHARLLSDFVFLSLQRGPREGAAKLFLITPTDIEEVAALIGEPTQPADLLRHILARAAESAERQMTPQSIERIGLVSQHLFTAKSVQGVFLRLTDITEKSIPKAFRDLAKQKPPEESDSEGILKELQAIE